MIRNATIGLILVFCVLVFFLDLRLAFWTTLGIPISFMGGDVGRLFGEFGFTLAAAVVISSVVALSLAPMLCSRWLHRHRKEDENHPIEQIGKELRGMMSFLQQG